MQTVPSRAFEFGVLAESTPQAIALILSDLP
jgi:hypothetical protein